MEAREQSPAYKLDNAPNDCGGCDWRMLSDVLPAQEPLVLASRRRSGFGSSHVAGLPHRFITVIRDHVIKATPKLEKHSQQTSETLKCLFIQ